MVGIPTVIGNAGNLAADAGDKVAAAAGFAIVAMATIPADADPLADLLFRYSFAHRVDQPDHLMAGNARIFDAGEQAQLGDRIAVAYATGLDLDADMCRRRLRDVALDQLERTICMTDL